MSKKFSDYIVFVDESGCPNLTSIDPYYPMFVLAFCIIRKDDYARKLSPAVQAFKFSHFGHDGVILHERDIRKDIGEFTILKSKDKKEAFLNELTDIVSNTDFTLITPVIRLKELKSRYVEPDNPYHLATEFGLERAFHYLRSLGQKERITHFIFEKRGKKEDAELELEFRRICDGANFMNEHLPFEIIFADKKANLTGLQLADLIARPIGMSILRPEQTNRAVEIVTNKFYTNNSGEKRGWGLKCFP